MNLYEYEYYSVWKKHPNTNTNIIRHGNFYRIRLRIRIVPTPYTSESIIQCLEVDLFLIVLNFNTHTHNGRYEIIPATSNPLNSVTVDLVLQELFEEEELEEDDSDVESDAYEGDESESGSDED